MILNCLKQIKFLLIHLIIMFQFVERSRLKSTKNMKFIHFMISIHKPKPIYLFGRSMLENNVEKYIHAFIHLCLVRV